MKWEEALNLARQGVKITHPILNGLYLTARGNYLYLSNNTTISIREFFKYKYEDNNFLNWEIWIEKY